MFLPDITRPRAVNHEESRSLVFELPKISVVPMLAGSLSIDFENSSSPTILAPPPTNTIPAGKIATSEGRLSQATEAGFI